MFDRKFAVVAALTTACLCGCSRRSLRGWFFLTLDTAVRRIGHPHLSAESAARVGREDRMQFANFVVRRGLSNFRELALWFVAFGVIDRCSFRSVFI